MGTRGLIGAAVLVLAATGTAAAVVVNARSGMPEVTAASSRCRAESPPPGASAAGRAAFVPPGAYRSAQLCAAAGDFTPVAFLDRDEAADLVERLNALPTTPPSAGCPAPGGSAVELILKEGLRAVVVTLDLTGCDAVRHDGAVRYGAREIHRHATALIGDGGN